jgi:hypothetical protein
MELVQKVIKEVREGFFSQKNEQIEFENMMVGFIKQRKLIPVMTELSNFVKQGLKFYNSPWKLSNSLFKCQIYCKNWDEDVFHFPLELMHKPDMLMYYDIQNAPNLVVFISDVSSAAIFTKTGFLSLAGGKMDSGIFRSLTICCCKIFYVLSHFYPDLEFGIRDFVSCNKVATTTLLLHKICIPRLIDDIRSYGFMAQQNQDDINFLYLKQFIPFRPSITFCISATGGINIIGFTHNFEVKWASLILSWFLKRHSIVTEPINMKSLKRARSIKKTIDEKRSVSREHKKSKKLLRWSKSKETNLVLDDVS